MKVFQSTTWKELSNIESDFDNADYRPLIFEMAETQQREQFERFVATKPPVKRYQDHLASNMKEWFKISRPQEKLSDKDLEQAWHDWKNSQDALEGYGCYIYYPWSGLLLHICAKEQFIALRTSRNQYKITVEEQQRLAEKTIGVIGLSVGQSVAVTLAMERVFGKLRMADFDHLELTNLNRIRKGLDYIGLPKVIMAAREIAEIDPFLEVELFPEGITDNNLSDFIGQGTAKLDLLIEECDSLDIKLKARLAARAAGIPVLMDTSDRGLVDIERFDLEPNRPILHGLVAEQEAKSASRLSSKERMSLVMKIVGVESVSSRLKASLLEVEQSISTWPQLASAVVYGGAISTIIARQILLGQAVQSGRHYFDPEAFTLKGEGFKNDTPPPRPPELSWTELEEIVQAQPRLSQQYKVDEALIEDMVSMACLAPSGGNVQPWKWFFDAEKGLFLFHDIYHSHSFLDYKHRGSLIGLGAALENLKQRASHWSLEAEVQDLVKDYRDILIARIAFLPKGEESPKLRFGDSLSKRLTNRKKGLTAAPVPPEMIEESKNLIDAPYFCSWMTDAEQIGEMAEIIGEVERLRVLNPWGHSDFIAEARWTAAEAEESRTGVDLRTMDLSETDKMGFQLIKDAKALKHLKDWNKGQGLVKMSKDTVECSSALVLLYTTEHSASAVLNGGMHMERLWLFLNEKSWAYQPVSPATFMFARIKEAAGEGDKELIDNLAHLRKGFLKMWNLPEEINELFVFRVFKANEPEVKSLRRPLNEVLKIKANQTC